MDFIRVGDKVFKVEIINNKLNICQPTESEMIDKAAEDVLLRDRPVFLIELERSFQRAQDELLQELTKEIKAIVLRILGFEKDSWSKTWRIDHCNGRMSKVSEYITHQVQDALRQLKISDEIKLTEQEQKDIDKELKDEYLRSYKLKTHELVRSLAYKNADKDTMLAAQAMFEDSKKNIK